MKIAVMSMGNTKESQICSQFGRAPYIIVYNTANNLYEAIENAGEKSIHGAGPDTADLIIKNGIDLLLTKKIGAKAYSVLAKAQVAIKLVTSESTVKALLKKYLKNNPEN
ncbi:MAG TPA: NifB/NifX family molybdenum-iron cluster-binding protein [Ignavibacteriaceae bacterium]|nr:NifB/NifX family molybdenum-iron cluster-binding protein [Ignavibacteriaceae bacterium]